MTTRQRKGIRTVFLTLLLLLLATGTFDSRQGSPVAQAGPSDVNSIRHPEGLMGVASFRPEAVIPRQDSEPGPNNLPSAGAVPMEEIKPVAKAPVGTGIVAPEVPTAPLPGDAGPSGPGGQSWSDNGGEGAVPEDTQFVKVRRPKPDSGPALEPEPGEDPPLVATPDEEGDRNKGHGNDEDGYDEDNPGRGASRDAAGSSGGRDRDNSAGRGHSGNGGRGSKK